MDVVAIIYSFRPADLLGRRQGFFSAIRRPGMLTVTALR